MRAKFREVLRRQQRERRELGRHDAHHAVDALHLPQRQPAVALLEGGRKRVEIAEQHLEPQLARLVHDDEQEFVGVLWRRARALEVEELLEGEIRTVRNNSARLSARAFGAVG